MCSGDFPTQLQRLKALFDCFVAAGPQLKRKKCHFAYPKIRVLGHVVSQKGSFPDPEEIKAVSAFLTPKILKGLGSSIGLCCPISNVLFVASPT